MIRTVQKYNATPSEQFKNQMPHHQNSSKIKCHTIRTVQKSNATPSEQFKTLVSGHTCVYPGE
jgi:hypothetical protein